MPYTLRKTNGTTLAIIQDGAIETSTDLVFVGKNYAGYGQTVNENFLKLLENFASPRIPASPLAGQAWFDTSALKLKVFDGTRFKSVGFTEVDNKRPSDLRAGDQWFDPVDQKLYVYNGTDFVMIGPEKTAAALQSQIAGILVQDDTFSSHTVLQASVGSGNGSMTAIFSSEAFVPNSNSAVVTDQNFANVARGITLPGTSAVTGSIDTTVIGALPDPTNQWSFFGAAGSSWGLLERDALGSGIVFYDSKNYIRRDEFTDFNASFTTRSNDGITIGTGRIIKLHVNPSYGNSTANFTNLQSTKINFNIQTNNTITNALSIDYSNSTIALIPNTQLGTPASPVNIATDLGTDTNRFRAGYIKTLYTNVISTTTSGTIQGTWTLGAGSSIIGGSVQATSAITSTNAVNLQSYDGVSFVHATIDETALSITQRRANGTVTVNGVNAGSTGTAKFIGTWEVGPTSSVQASTILGDGSTGFVSASQATSNNSIVQRSSNGGIYASSLNSQYINAGTLESTNGYISGQWSLVGTSTLEATYADIAERYEADAAYEPATVLIVGGDKEVTVSSVHGDVRVAGIVSTNPAFKLNAEAGADDTHPYIALKGRVPCKVTGWIKKGNRLVTSQKPGYAEAFREGDDPSAVIGIALAHKETSGDGIIEVLVK